MEDTNEDVRRGTARSLGGLASVDSESAASLYEKGMEDTDGSICLNTTESLGEFS